MKYILLSFLSILCLKANDTSSVDTSNFDFNFLMPVELSYINTKDDGALYCIGTGIGFALEYNPVEFQISLMLIPYSHSITPLETIFNKKYEGTLLYRYNNQWQIGIDYSKYINVVVTNEGSSTLLGDAYGDMYSYSLKLLYDPIESYTDKRKNTLLFGLSLGYLNTNNIKYSKIDFDEWQYTWNTVEKKYDFSGFISSLSFIYKF